MVREKTYYCRFIIPEGTRKLPWIPVAAASPEAAIRKVRSGTDAPVEVRSSPPFGGEVLKTRAWIEPEPSDVRVFDGKRYQYYAGDTGDPARVARIARELRESGHLARVVKAKGGVSHIYWYPRFGRQGWR
jgi:hypothetical protein